MNTGFFLSFDLFLQRFEYTLEYQMRCLSGKESTQKRCPVYKAI
jgi:hypothetical protein